MIRTFASVCVLILCICAPAFAQDEAAVLNSATVPARSSRTMDFAPKGWKIEQQLKGDLNGDGLTDYALQLVEDKAAKDSEDLPTERGRALVIVLGTTVGELKRVGVASRLLQCTRCGGAFYGVVETPVSVTLEKGVVVVQQDHGSRDVTDTTYRFRYDPASDRFVLIGFDLSDRDRATASYVFESTNYATGVRETTRSKNQRDVKARTTFAKKKIFLEDVSSEEFEAAAYKRLGLD